MPSVARFFADAVKSSNRTASGAPAPATYTWTQPVLIDQPLTAAVAQDPERGNTIALTAQAVGGAAGVVAAHWTFSDGTTTDGTTITLPHRHLDGSVTITDGAGNRATTGVHIN
jgi:hypothetical protein